MPRFDLRLSAEAVMANEVVTAGERSRLLAGNNWTPKRLEFLYEIAYLRLFAAWESTLESMFLRSLCGYASSVGQETMVCGRHYATLSAAEGAVLTAESRGHHIKTYVLWHSPTQIINRCKRHIQSGGPAMPALQERIIASNQARLDALAAIRHRIVHDQSDARTQFDNATRMFAGRTYPASRPGKFLRDYDPTVPRQRWIDSAIAELTGLARQMV